MTARPTLPQNFQQATPIWSDGFEDLSGWAKSGDAAGTAVADTVNCIEGSQSIALTPTTDWPGVIVTKTVDIDASAMDTFSFLMYIPTGAAGTYNIEFSPDTSFTKKATAAGNLNLSGLDPDDFWNRFVWHKSSFTLAGGFVWTEKIIRCRIRLVGVTGPTVHFDGFRIGMKHRAKCVIMFDDTNDTDYTVAYPYMTARGIPGTCFLNSNNVGIANRCTLAQVQELYAAGWAICGHTAAHTVLTGLPIAEQEAAIQTTIDYLLENDMPRCAYYFAYPNNSYDANAIQACENLGVVSARAGGNLPQGVPVDDLYRLKSYGVVSTNSLATRVGWIDSAIQKGQTIMLYFHGLHDPAGQYEDTPTLFQQTMDYLVSKKAAIDCITYDEWLNGLTNPRYRSLPLTRA